MILSVKRKTILTAVVAIVSVLTLCLVVSFSSLSAYSVPKLNKVVVIDAGHGGIDGGVLGVSTGTKESDINLAIARQVKHFLLTRGYDVVMTRTTTDGLYGTSAKNKKAKDMEARKRIISEARPQLVVSIHCNSYPLQSSYGAQVFYAPNSEEGKGMADLMQGMLVKNLSTKRVAMKGDYFILQCTPYASLLVECGFLTNPTEERQLISAKYQEKVAYTIFSGIHSILSDGEAENNG